MITAKEAQAFTQIGTIAQTELQKSRAEQILADIMYRITSYVIDACKSGNSAYSFNRETFNSAFRVSADGRVYRVSKIGEDIVSILSNEPFNYKVEVSDANSPVIKISW